MKQYEMPYSFIFTDEELCDLWSHYRQISQIIRCVEERHRGLCRNSVLRRSLCFCRAEDWIFFRRLIFEDFSKISDSQDAKLEISA